MKRRRSLFIHLSHIRLLTQKFALVILFLSTFVFMLVNKTNSVLIEETSSVAIDIVSPAVDVLVIPARIISKFYDYFRDLRLIHKDNQRLKEENERQKQQLLQSQKNEELARKEAKSSKIFSYISFGVATVLSIIALVVAIIK